MDNKAVRRLRRDAGLNQARFWTRLGITQSGGSRYEVGSRRIPLHVALLVTLVYGRDPMKTLRKLREARPSRRRAAACARVYLRGAPKLAREGAGVVRKTRRSQAA